MKQYQEAVIPLWYRIFTPFFLLFLTGLTYYPSLHYEFQFDDLANITKHFNIRHYTLHDLVFSGTRWISYWLDSLHYKISKFDPFSYRLGNLVIHCINGLLIFFILLAILPRLIKKPFFVRHARSLSFLTSLLFLLHPVQTQTVSYVIQGKLEGLAALFSLSMIGCFLCINYLQQSLLRFLFFISFFLLAILSTGTKEIVIVTPALIMLIDWFFVAQGSWLSLKKRLLFHVFNTLIVVGLYIYLLKIDFFVHLFGLKISVGNNLGNIITSSSREPITSLHFFISQFKVILHYLWIFIWPFNISVEYDWILVKGFFAPDCILPFLLLVLIGIFIYRLLKKDSTTPLGFAALWFIINILPRSSILPSPELVVDYKTYLASFGWLFIITTTIIKGFEYLQQKSAAFYTMMRTYRLHYSLPIIFAVYLSFITFERNKVWRSGLEFWANVMHNAPGKARVYNNYGVELSQKLGRFADSIPYFQHAIRIDPEYRDSYNNLAVAYAAIYQIDRAIETLKLSLQINPYYPEAYNNIASFLLEKKDYEQARKALLVALQLRPHYGKAHFNLARVYMEEGKPQEAYHAFKKACMEADLDNEAGFLGYAKSCLFLKKYDEAIFACKKVLEFNPNNYEIEFNLANVYYLKNDFTNACATYKNLLSKNPSDEKIWYNLAESYLSSKNPAQALQCFERVQHNPSFMPTIFIRMAVCYEELGNPQLAKRTLEKVLAIRELPQQAKNSITTTLHKLNKQYHLA